MAARRVRVRVHMNNGALSAETSPGGNLYQYVARLDRLVYQFAVADAPARSGQLKASHVNAGVRKVGRYKAQGSINNTAEHALWVHDGTTGPIHARRGPYLSVPQRRGSTRRVLRLTVSGQRGNPWLFRAGQKAAAIMGGEVRRGRV